MHKFSKLLDVEYRVHQKDNKLINFIFDKIHQFYVYIPINNRAGFRIVFVRVKV